MKYTDWASIDWYRYCVDEFTYWVDEHANNPDEYTRKKVYEYRLKADTAYKALTDNQRESFAV